MSNLSLTTKTVPTEIVYPRLGMPSVVLLGLFALLVGVFLVSVAMGSVDIPLKQVVIILLGGEADKTSWSTIVLKFRLPKSLTATLAGAALGVSGLQVQTLFRNPLAGPDVLGLSAGASLGVALTVLGTGFIGSSFLVEGFSIFGSFTIALAACLGAGIVMMMVLVVSQRVQNAMTLLIVGLMFGFATNAIVSVMLYFSITEQIQSYIAWTFGSFAGVTWGQMKVFAPIVLFGLLIASLLSKPMNALLLGETYASSMGVRVSRARFWIILSTAILSGIVTAFCGPISFLGIAVPHLCRSLFGTSDHRTLIPATMMMGATLALIADLVAQVPGSQIVLPLNAITALIGAPVVTWVILRRQNLRASFAG
jgi:iron complex transport system permease protein